MEEVRSLYKQEEKTEIKVQADVNFVITKEERFRLAVQDAVEDAKITYTRTTPQTASEAAPKSYYPGKFGGFPRVIRLSPGQNAHK